MFSRKKESWTSTTLGKSEPKTKKTSVRFPKSSGFFSLFSPLFSPFVLSFPHKRTKRKREETSTRDNKNNNNNGCTVVSSKKTNSDDGEGEKIEVLFSTRHRRHDRRPRRVQVAEIRSEEHQIGVVPEKLLPMHASRLSREETGRKRRRKVRKRTQSREAELAAAQPKDGFAPRKIWEGREEEE